MKGESKEKKIRKVRVWRREKSRRRKQRERKRLCRRGLDVSEEASAVAVAITVHCFVEGRQESDDEEWNKRKSLYPKSHSPTCPRLWLRMGFKLAVSFSQVHMRQN